MKKFTPLSASMTGLFVAVFNVGFFTCVSDFTATRWVSWLFIHVAYALLVLASRTIPDGKGGLVYGYPRIYVAAVCFLVELALGVVFTVANPSGVTFPMLAQLVLIAAFVFVYQSLLAAEKHAPALEQKTARDLYHFRDFTLRLQAAMKSAEDTVLRGEIERVYDAARGAQVTSHPSVVDTEAELLVLADAIAAAVANDPAAIPGLLKKTQALIIKRDNAIRLAR